MRAPQHRIEQLSRAVALAFKGSVLTRLQESTDPGDTLLFAYDLRPRALRVRWHFAVASVLFAVLFIAAALGAPSAIDYALLAGGYFAIAGAALWLSVRPRAAPGVALGSAGAATPSLTCPSLWHLRGQRRVALADVRRLAIAPIHGHAVLFVEVLRQPVAVLQLDRFATLDEAKRFVDALVFRTRRPLQDLGLDYGVTAFTLAGVTLLIGLHVARQLVSGGAGGDVGSSANWLALLQWGALNRALLLDGDWFRLITLVLVQPHTLALGLNAAALCALVPGLQRNLGSAAVLLLMVVGAVASGIGALSWLDGQVALGASGLVYGLIGAVVWLRISQPARVPPTIWALPVWLWIAWLVIDLGAALFTPGVGLPLRVLALIGGCAFAGVLEQCERGVPRVVAWCSLLAMACVLAAVLRWGMLAVASPNGALTALQLVESDNAGLADANMGAWLLATAADADDAALQRAREQFSKRLLLSSDMTGENRDTLATLNYRLGDFAAATELEAQLQHETPTSVYASQLARFSRARGGDTDRADAGISRRPDRVCVDSRSAGSADIDVLLFDDQKLIGLLQFHGVTQRACHTVRTGLPERARLELGRVAPAWRSGTFNVQYWTLEPSVLALP